MVNAPLSDDDNNNDIAKSVLHIDRKSEQKRQN
jgi:hypothetical protein